MAWACWEKQMTGEWQLVVYSEKPGKSVNGSNPTRSELYEVPSKMVREDGTVNIDEVEKVFKKPQDNENV